MTEKDNLDIKPSQKYLKNLTLIKKICYIFFAVCSLALMSFLTPAFCITIDGSFNDWNAIPLLGEDAVKDAGAGDAVDWTKFWLAAKNGALFISYETEKNIDFYSNAWRYNVYIDSDNRLNTGYRGADNSLYVRADFLLQGATLYRYTGNGTSWNWQREKSCAYGINGSRFEASILEKDLSLTAGYSLKLFFYGANTVKPDCAKDNKDGFIFPVPLNNPSDKNINWWKFDESSGNKANNVYSQNNTGIINGALYTKDGFSNTALVFNGGTNYVLVPYNESFDFKEGALSLEAWINLPKYPSYTADIISKYNGAVSGCFLLSVLPDGRVCFSIESPWSYIFSTNKLSLNKWHHITAVFDGTKKYIYIDAELDSQNTGGGLSIDNNPVLIGARLYQGKPAHHFKGQIDEVKVYGYALKPEDIVKPSLINTVLSCWEMNEGSGAVVHDSSSNQNHGTIYKACWAAGKFGSALEFKEDKSYVDFGTGPSMRGSVNFTVEVWIKTSSKTKQVIIQQRNGGYNGEYQLAVLSNGKVNWWTYGDYAYGFNLVSQKNINDGNWHYIAGAREDGKGLVYIDGVLDISAYAPARNLDSAIKTAIGRDIRDNSNNFIGLIDEVKIHKCALSAGEILDRYKKADFTPPKIKITFPSQGQIVTAASITVTGGIDDNKASVDANGVKAAVSNGVFSASNVPLSEGKNTVTVTAADLAGNTSKEIVTVIYKVNHAPQIVKVTPAEENNLEAGEFLKIEVTALDSDGDSLEYQFKIDGIVKQSWGLANSCAWKTTTQDIGACVIICEVRDICGFTTAQTVTCNVSDSLPPQISITAPGNNSVYTLLPVRVSGTVTDDAGGDISVNVNGQTAIAADGIFNVDLSNLTLGQNTITARAEDQSGNNAAVQVGVIYDNTPPQTPVVKDDGEYTTNLTQLHAVWTSNDPETEVREYQYGLGANPGAADIADWTSAGTQTEITHANLNLIKGKTYYITVRAINSAGLISEGCSDGITVQDENSLSVKITSPQDGACLNSAAVTIEGVVSKSEAAVTVNNMLAVIENNTFTYAVKLKEGENKISARASLNEMTAADEITVYVDEDAPSISIFTPDEDVETKSNLVYGRTSQDADSITVNGLEAEIIDISGCYRYFIAEPDLREGVNTISIETYDTAKNTASKSLAITYNITAPKIAITSPQKNCAVNLSPIKVEGIVLDEITYVYVDSVNLTNAAIENNAFAADDLKLTPQRAVVTATGCGKDNKKYQDSIIIDTPQLRHYELMKVSGESFEYGEEILPAGAAIDLTLKLYCNNAPAYNEGIEFKVIEGNGVLSAGNALTDIDGIANVVFTADTNAGITNKIEAFPLSCPGVTTVFNIDTKAGEPAKVIKITGDNQTPAPGAQIPLIVKLTDAYDNFISDEEINFAIVQGAGVLSSAGAPTNCYGEANVNFTAPMTPKTQTQISAQAALNPSAAYALFNITTSPALTVTAGDIIAKVNANDEKIKDIQADIIVTSNADFLPPEMHLKIWQKGGRQKVEETYPEHETKIRPLLETSAGNIEMDRQIISCGPGSNIYAIKTRQHGQAEEYPYQIDYVDYTKGVIVMTEYYSNSGDEIDLYAIEDSDFILINDVWVFQRETEILYKNLNEIVYTTINIYSNIQINTGMSDEEFQ